MCPKITRQDRPGGSGIFSAILPCTPVFDRQAFVARMATSKPGIGQVAEPILGCLQFVTCGLPAIAQPFRSATNDQ